MNTIRRFAGWTLRGKELHIPLSVMIKAVENSTTGKREKMTLKLVESQNG
jgi:hypothetical protein